MAPNSLTFPDLLAPTTVDGFVDEHWQRRPCHLEGSDPRRFGALAAPSHIDGWVAVAAEAGPRRERLQTVRRGESGPESYTLPWSGGSTMVRRAVEHAASIGYTIIVNGLHTFDPGVAEVSRSFEEHLGLPVGANLYLTPPAAAGLRPHADPLETFLLQLAGSKTWRVAPPGHELPILEERGPSAPPTFEPEIEVQLKAGEILYLPRGWLHAGESTDDVSVHLSVQAKPLTWFDLAVSHLRAVAASSVELRRAVPISRAWTDTGRQALDEQVLAHLVAAAATPTTATMDHLTDLLAARPRPLGGQLMAGCEVTRVQPGTRLRRHQGLPPLVVDDGVDATIRFAGGRLTAPVAAAEALRQVAGAATVVPRDLPGLGADEQVALCRALVEEGLLVPADG